MQILKKIIRAIKFTIKGDLIKVIKTRSENNKKAQIFEAIKEDKKKAWEYNYKKEDSSYKYYSEFFKKDPLLYLNWLYDAYFSPKSRWSKFYDWNFA